MVGRLAFEPDVRRADVADVLAVVAHLQPDLAHDGHDVADVAVGRPSNRRAERSLFAHPAKHGRDLALWRQPVQPNMEPVQPQLLACQPKLLAGQPELQPGLAALLPGVAQLLAFVAALLAHEPASVPSLQRRFAVGQSLDRSLENPCS